MKQSTMRSPNKVSKFLPKPTQSPFTLNKINNHTDTSENEKTTIT